MNFKIKNKKGFFFTIGVVIILIPLIFLISFYTGISKTKIDDTAGKIRCDELHYFVEDVKRDLQRAVVIFGRRAVIHATGYVAEYGNLGNYTFNCTPLCGVNCDKFSYNNNGSEAAIAELILCGTLSGENVSYMVNHTLREWVEKIEERGDEAHFKTNITIMNITIAQIDAWNFATIIEIKLKVSDESGMCFYRETRMSATSNTSIIGLEDPLYLLSTEGHVMNYIWECESNITAEFGEVIGESQSGSGNGTGSGNVILESSIPEPETFCSDNDVSGLILVMENGFGSCGDFEGCFNASAPESDHFAGVINYGKNDAQSFVEKCGITIPWIRDTGDINLSDDDCIIIKNSDRCGIHQVRQGIPGSAINSSCYVVSNITGYNKNCSMNYSNGPCFFDRLDGNYNLSKKYTEQSQQYFNNTLIGIETFIDFDELELLGIQIHQNATWIDYLYWQNVTGCKVIGACISGNYGFRLDCPHARNYNLDSSCSIANIPPVSNITEPSNNAELNCSDAPFDIRGMADDCDGSISYVEVSINGIWHNTDWNGTYWNYTWDPVMNGSYNIKSRATDELGMEETPTLKITVNVTDCV